MMTPNDAAAQTALYDYANELREIDCKFDWEELQWGYERAIVEYERRIIEANGFLKLALDSANAPDWMYPTGR